MAKKKKPGGGGISSLSRPPGPISQLGVAPNIPVGGPVQQPQPVGQPLSTVFQPIPVPTLTVNANGILELPYDNQFSSAMLDAVFGANNQLMDLKTQADQQALNYSQGLRNSDLAYGQQQRRTKNTNASSGTLFSSRMATGVVNDATEYANTRADIESKNTAFQQDRAARQAAIQQSLQNQLGRLAQDRADELNRR